MKFRERINSQKQNDKFGILIFCGIMIIVLFGIGKQYWEQKQIYENKGTTTGIIIEYSDAGYRGDALIYEYYVKGKKYVESVAVSSNTDKKAGKKLKKKFKVYFNKKKPENSVIDLSDLEEFKTYVEFFDF